MLNSPAITELTTEDGPLNLLGEWLRVWFNGGLNAVGANAAASFPAVNVAFNQSAAVQPMFQFGSAIDTTIRVVMLPRMETVEHCDTILGAGKLATARVLINFWVQAKHPVAGQAEQAAQTVANLLKAILTNPWSKYDLGLKGLRMQSPEPPRPIAGVDYSQRLVACGAELLYPILFGTQPPALVVGDGVPPVYALGSLSVAFTQPNDLIAGAPLLGLYQWTGNVQVVSATVQAYAPQLAPVVLGLQVNGVPVPSATITIPVGPVNTPVTATAALGVTVAAGQTVQWVVVSAPDPVDSAWGVSLGMQVTALAQG